MRLESYRERVLGKVESTFRAAVLDTHADMVAHAPVRTGDMRRRVQIQWLGRLRARIGLNHPGARMREFGGTITAKRGRYLTFKTRDGNWVRVRQVTQRPGGYSQGFRPWIRPAGRRFGQHWRRHLARS